MLTAGAPPLESVRGSSSLKVTASDVAACLTRVDRFTYLYGLAKFAGDYGSNPELISLALIAANKHQFERSAKEPKLIIYKLGLMALLLSTRPQLCRKCGGVGELTVGNELIQCPSCEGVGVKKIPSRKLKRILGVSGWRARLWQKRLSLLLSEYSVMESEISKAIHRGLKE